MKRYLLLNLLLLLAVLPYSISAQIATEAPLLSDLYPLNTTTPSYRMPSVDHAAMLAEDAVEDKGLPLRFGKRLPVQLNLQNAGVWENLPNGGRLWRLRIEAPGAYSVSILYEHFEVPAGAQLFLYNDQKDYRLGAFTRANQKVDYRFATTPVPGDALTLEYYEPAAVRGQGRIELGTVVHAYRNLFPNRKDSRNFGASGSCNNDVACPISLGWEDPIKSVALIIVGGSRACTGAMINNTNNDNTPYFLTADHCMGGATAGTQLNNWSFVFNYQSPTCNGPDGNLSQSITGAVVRATFDDSDVALLELSSMPPSSYNVFYAGWNRANVPADTVCGIHHPRGDVKKITFDYDPVTSTSGLSGVPNSHWEISVWDDGTTEPGSSGSPLFDQNQRIIGQLHGGTASCTSLTYDAYGKFSMSWLGGGMPGSQLQPWLDPNNTGAMVLDGKFQTLQPLDLAVQGLGGIVANSTLCDTIVQPVLTLRNVGDSSVTNFDLTYQYTGLPTQSISWTGNLASFDTAVVALPQQTLSPGSYSLTVFLNNTNGLVDNNTSNDSLSVSFDVISGEQLVFNLQTDFYPSETSFEVLDANFNVIDQVSSGLSQSTLSQYDYCVSPTGCYYFVVNDSYGDGLSGFFGQGQGYASLYYQGAAVDSLWGPDFDFSDTLQFCFPSTVPTASFSLASSDVCIGQVVEALDNSSGASSWQWSMPGATPSSSTQTNPSFSYAAAGQYTVSLTVFDAQGNSASSSTTVQVTDDQLFEVQLQTDNQPADLTLSLVDDQGNLLYSNDNYSQSNSLESVDFCLEDGCYTFIIEDASGNGFGNNNGALDIFLQGLPVGGISGNFGSVDSITICAPLINNQELEELAFRVYPNPSSDRVMVQSPVLMQGWRLFSPLGQQLREGQAQERQFELSLGDLPAGLYLLQVEINGTWQVQSVLKQ